MFRLKPPLAVLVALLVLLGLVGLPAASATPPSDSGVVERGEADVIFWDFDEKSKLVALFNLNLEEFCHPSNAPDPFWTDTPEGIGRMAEQLVFTRPLAATSDPETGEPLPFPSFGNQLKRDDVKTMVWELDDEFGAFLEELEGLDPSEGDFGFWTAFCGWFGTREPLASGYTRFRSTDNDVFADISDNNRSNAWGYVANGNLMDNGTKYRFHATVRISWSGVIPPDRFHVAVKITLH